MPALPRPDRDLGVFETLLIAAGRAVELDAHLERLRSSLSALFPALDPPDVSSASEALAEELGEGAMRVTVAPRDGILTATVDRIEIEPRLVLPPSPHSLAVGRTELRGGLGAHKWVDRRTLELAQAALPGSVLPLIVDVGAVLEASRANVFAVRDGDLVTPPLDGRILPGISRKRVLELAESNGLNRREATLRPEDLLSADEVFLTSSVRGVERVVSLDGQPLPRRGEVGERLAAELRKAWRGSLDRVPRR